MFSISPLADVFRVNVGYCIKMALHSALLDSVKGDQKDSHELRGPGGIPWTSKTQTNIQPNADASSGPSHTSKMELFANRQGGNSLNY